MNEQQEKQLQQLFKEEFTTPKHLNHNIMQQIRLIAQQPITEVKELPKSLWIGLYVFFGSFSLGLIVYIMLNLKISTNITYWILGLAAGIPLLIDFVLKFRNAAKV